MGLLLVGVALFAAGSLGASIGSGKHAAVAEYEYPGVLMDAAPNPIAVGGSSTLTWSSTDVTSCTAFGDWAGVRPVNGTEVVEPWGWERGFFGLDCNGPDGEAGNGVQVVVRQPITPRAVVDQQQVVADDLTTDARIGQTFTVGTSGWLTDVVISGTGLAAYDRLAVTRTTPDGAPDPSHTLWWTTVSNQATLGTVQLTKPLFVLAGQHLAVTLTAPDFQPGVNDVYQLSTCAEGDRYRRGDLYVSDEVSGEWTRLEGCDAVFQTDVVRRLQAGP